MFHLSYFKFLEINLNIYERTINISLHLYLEVKTGRAASARDAVDLPDTNHVELRDHSPWPSTARLSLTRLTFLLKTCSFSIPSHYLLYYSDDSSHYIQPIAVEMLIVLDHSKDAMKKRKII